MTMSGNLSLHDPAAKTWRHWKLPGDNPRPYAVWVDERDKVWVSDFSGNAIFRFDPDAERFERFGFPREAAAFARSSVAPARCGCPKAAPSTSR